MPRKKAFATLVLAAVAAAAVFAIVSRGWERARPGAREEAALPASAFLASLRREGQIARKFSTLHELTGTDALQDWRVKIEAFDSLAPEGAAALVEEGIVTLEALYADALSPYPGDVSRRIVHDEETRPRLHAGSRGPVPARYFTLYASSRLGYGVTSRELLAYRSLLGWIYCTEAHTLFKVRIFAPLDTDWRDLETEFLAMECP